MDTFMSVWAEGLVLRPDGFLRRLCVFTACCSLALPVMPGALLREAFLFGDLLFLSDVTLLVLLGESASFFAMDSLLRR